MTIRFKCTHCQKPLSVHDQFAGKKGKCPACKKGISIPAPKSVPAAPDVDDLAVAAFREQPPVAASAPEPTTVDFACPYCDEAIQINAELAGRQAPCPQCRRIIKVPLLKKDGPVDWRKPGARGPSGARQAAEPAPAGAWDSSLQTRRVSEDALLDAGVITEEREPWSLRKKVTVFGGAAAMVGLIVGAFWLGIHLRNQSRQSKAIERALQAAGSDGSKPLLGARPEDGWERDAAIHLAAGKFYLATGNSDCAAKAQKHFSTALAFLIEANKRQRARLIAGEQQGPRYETDLLLIELALAQVDLGGEGTDVEKGRRLKWEEVTQKELTRSLGGIFTPDMRIEGLRAVSRKLAQEKKQDKLTATLATQVSNTALAPELLAAAGLELFRAGNSSAADGLAHQALRWHQNPPPPPMIDNAAKDQLAFDFGEKGKPANKGDKGVLAPPPSSVVALGTALGKKDLFDPKAANSGVIAGVAEGLAHRGELEAARRQTNTLDQVSDRLKALVGIAAATSAKDATDLEVAVSFAEKNPTAGTSAAVVRHLIDLAREAKRNDLLDKLAGSLRDPDLRAWAQLEALRRKMADGKDKADDALADPIDKNHIARALALEAIARANARREGQVPSTVDGWDEKLKPFGYAGAALGMQDRSR